MTKWIYMLALLPVLAWAQPNQDHTCQGGHNCNEGGGSNEQSQEQNQGQSQSSNNTNTNSSNSQANAGASADSSSNSYSGGNSMDVYQGGSSSSSSASGGTANATGGESVAHGGEGGDAVAHGGRSGDSSAVSGGNSQDISVEGDTNIDNSSYSYVEEDAASSAAAVFAGYCQTGVSGQIVEGGFSIVHTEQFCNHIRLADVMWQAAEREKRCQVIEVGYTDRGGNDHITDSDEVCKYTEKGEKFLDAYYDNLLDAQALVEVTEGTSMLDALSKQLVTPLGLIGALIWLI